MTELRELRHQPCPDCGSSDALTRYPDHTYCFRCNSFHYLSIHSDNRMNLSTDKVGTTYQYVPWRGITQESMKFYEAITKVSPEGVPESIEFKYGNGRVKVRGVAEKAFYTTDSATKDTGYLFGRDKFGPNCAKAITITEGELDCVSAFQMLGSKYY